MGHERRVRSISLHPRRRAQHEQAPRLGLIAGLVALLLLAPGVAHAQAPAPFGPGATLEVVSSGDQVWVYVARLAGAPGSPVAGEFVKVGRTPLEMQLPPGGYRIEAEGLDISNGGTEITMHSAPRRLSVSPGKEGMGTVGSLFLGLGITGILGATAILASGTSAPAAVDKPAVLIPAYAAGAALTAGGIGFLAAANTSVEATPAPQIALSLSGRF